MAKKGRSPAKKKPATPRTRKQGAARAKKTAVAKPRQRLNRPGIITAPIAGSPIATNPVITTPPVAVIPARPPGPIVGEIEGVVPIRPDLPILAPDHEVNFFERSRPGGAVVRPEDLLALRVELRNLAVTAGNPPRLQKSATGAAYLILHFPPQAITEQTFFETRPPGMQNPKRPNGSDDKPDPPGGSEELTGPPIRARIAGESRLAFEIPDGFDIEYSLEALLAAVEGLALSVTSNALPPGTSYRRILVDEIFAGDLSRLSANARASLASYALRSFRIAAVQGDLATLQLRQAVGGPGLSAVRPESVIIDVGVTPGFDPGGSRFGHDRQSLAHIRPPSSCRGG
jgi:hypothetical protein